MSQEFADLIDVPELTVSVRKVISSSQVTDPMAVSEIYELRFGDGQNNLMTIADTEFGIVGMGGNDTLNGGSNNDYLIGDYFDIDLLGDDPAGPAPFDGSIVGDDLIYGGGGDDALFGGSGNDSLFGGNGDDYIAMYVKDIGINSIAGGDGYDYIDFFDGWDENYSSVNLMSLDLSKSASIEKFGSGVGVNGTSDANFFDLSGVDTIDFYGQASSDGIDLLGGKDTYKGGAGNDTVTGGDGADSLTGGGGVDSLSGDKGADTLDGGGDSDLLSGGDSADTMSGGNGKDTLAGGGSSDFLTGGAGNDVFVFDTAPGSGNADALTDFNVADDTIWLEKTGNGLFDTLATGALSADKFKIYGNGSIDSNDRILYDSTTGKIFYDADGSGAGAKVLFATVAVGTTLSAADFFVI